MHLGNLNAEIVLTDLVPLLSTRDLLSLTAVDKHLFGLLNHLRFAKTVVSRGDGFIINFLRHLSLETIQTLELNGSTRENDLVYCSPSFNNVSSATLVTPIAAGQEITFARFVRRLSHLAEKMNDDDSDDDDYDDEQTTSLDGLPAGCLSNLRSLYLEVSMPANIGSLLSVPPRLTRITYLPSLNMRDPVEFKAYADTLKSLLHLCSDRAILPALSLLHVLPGSCINAAATTIRAGILQDIWLAAARHGGWKLLADKPEGNSFLYDFGTYEVFWSQKEWDFSLVADEFEAFKTVCDTLGIYPRLEDFVSGKIKVDISEPPVRGAFMTTVIDSVTIAADAKTELYKVLRVIMRGTTAITITLKDYWGERYPTEYNPDFFRRVKAIRIQGPFSKQLDSTRTYSENIAAGLVTSLSVKGWHNLVHLSLPVHAFQAAPAVDGEPDDQNYAMCGSDVGAYDLTWLTSCESLRAIHFMSWLACFRCELPPNISFEGGLRHLPLTVQFVLVSGNYRCPDHMSAYWKALVYGKIMDSLCPGRPDISVSLRRLRIGVL